MPAELRRAGQGRGGGCESILGSLVLGTQAPAPLPPATALGCPHCNSPPCCPLSLQHGSSHIRHRQLLPDLWERVQSPACSGLGRYHLSAPLPKPTFSSCEPSPPLVRCCTSSPALEPLPMLVPMAGRPSFLSSVLTCSCSAHL